MVDQSVLDYCNNLTSLGIENTILEHSPAREIEDVLRSLNLSLADCIPTLIMQADKNCIAVLIRGDTRANFKKIKKVCGVKDLRMATPEEFFRVTMLPAGAARVYTPNLKTIIDTKVFEQAYLTGGSGRFDCSIRVKTADLKNIPDCMVADIHQD